MEIPQGGRGAEETQEGGRDSSGFIAQCEFLQFCPMVNLFQAARLLHSVSLRGLAQAAKGGDGPAGMEQVLALFDAKEWGVELCQMLCAIL